jgi:hypothetical protein
MYGFMAMVFIAMDYCVISGPHSIMFETFGNSDPANFAQANCPTGEFCRVKFKNFLYLGKENLSSNEVQAVGMLGNMMHIGVPGSVYDKQSHPLMMNLGINFAVVDIPTMAAKVNKTTDRYLLDVALSFLVTALMAYIMYALMSYIPDVAGSLIGQGTSAASQVTKAEVLGQAGVMYALELAKEAALAVATSGVSLKRKAAEEGIKMAEKMASDGENKNEGGAGNGGGIPTTGGDKDKGGKEEPKST